MDRNSGNRRLKSGFTTVFLSVILMVFILALLVIVEAASGYAAKSITGNVSAVAGRSILSEYNPSLYKRYGIFALDKSDYFIRQKADFYINNSLEGTSGIVKVKASSIAVDSSGYKFTTDELERQIKAVAVSVDQYVLSYCSNKLEPMENTAVTSEAEAVICGKETDEENDNAIKLRIIAVRTAFNVAEIYKDSAKMAEIRTMAYLIFPNLATEAAIAAAVTVAAGIEANKDYKTLMSGGTVPVLDMEWSDGFGSYKDYLLMFLIAENQEKKLERLMDVMEANCKLDGYDFSFNTAVYGFDLDITYTKSAYASLLGVTKRSRHEVVGFTYK